MRNKSVCRFTAIALIITFLLLLASCSKESTVVLRRKELPATDETGTASLTSAGETATPVPTPLPTEQTTSESANPTLTPTPATTPSGTTTAQTSVQTSAEPTSDVPTNTVTETSAVPTPTATPTPATPTVVHTHQFGEWTVSRSATCTESGEEKRVCAECGEEEVREIPPTGHGLTEIRGRVEPTDSENGYSGDEYCTVCGMLVNEGVILPAKEHNLILINQAEATCTKDGYTGDEYCVDCQKIIVPGTVIPATGHVPGVPANEMSATCTQDGYTGDFFCIFCGALVEKGEIISAYGHEFVNGICMRCGVTEKEIYGDFGASFPERFTEGGNSVVLNSDAEIRAYAQENGLTLADVSRELSDVNAVNYQSFYRSHDLCTTLYSFGMTRSGYYAKYYVFDIYVRNLENFYTVAGKQKDLHEHIADAEKMTGGELIIAVNGDYSGNSSQCRVVLRNGTLMREPNNINTDVCVMYKDGTIVTYSPEKFNYEQIMAKNPYQIWNFGPALLDSEGKALTWFNEDPYDHHVLQNVHPRTALGYYEPGHYCFVVVDGRQEDENGNMLYGCTIKALSSFMQSLGCKSAYNMDGGASSQAYMNKTDVRLDGSRPDQRVLSDILCIGEIPKETEDRDA